MSGQIKLDVEELESINSELISCKKSLDNIEKKTSNTIKIVKSQCGLSIELSAGLMRAHLATGNELESCINEIRNAIKWFKIAEQLNGKKVTEISDPEINNGTNTNSINTSDSTNETNAFQSDYISLDIPVGQVTSEVDVFGDYVSLCSVMAFATAMSIVYGTNTDPNDYVVGQQPHRHCEWNDPINNVNYYDKWENNPNWSNIYNSLKDNHPTILHYDYSRSDRESGEHYVTIVGVVDGADLDNLDENSFLVIDSNDGSNGVPKPFSDIIKNPRKEYYWIKPRRTLTV